MEYNPEEVWRDINIEYNISKSVHILLRMKIYSEL